MLARISSQRRLWRVLAGTMAVAAVALAVGAGCGDDDDGPLASRTDPYDLVIVAGNNQRGEPEEALAQPLVVQAVKTRVLAKTDRRRNGLSRHLCRPGAHPRRPRGHRHRGPRPALHGRSVAQGLRAGHEAEHMGCALAGLDQLPS